MEIDTLHLRTARLSDLKMFYADILDCPVTKADSGKFTIEIGTTDVTFSEVNDGSNPFYHFAINIPQNQFEAATTWLADRVELLSDPDTGEQQFSSSRYSQVYCHDPVGNIVELIARHDLSNDAERSFGSENFLQVSEIGLPVPDVRRAVEGINENVGVSPRDSRVSEISDDVSFAAVGNDHGVFIIVNEGRGWFPTRNQTAEVYPRTVGISEAAGEYTFPNLPYHILPP